MSALVALVPAAGRGARFGGEVPKQFLEIAGRPIVTWTLERLLAFGAQRIVVALPDPGALADLGWRGERRVRAVAGGTSRQASVAACLAVAEVSPEDLVAVHDGARPAVAREDFAAVVTRARQSGAAVLGRAVGDTLKRVRGGRVIGTVDRHELFRAETPQVFRAEILTRAIALAAADAFHGTDESALVERLPGVEIDAVEALLPNPKLTVAADLEAVNLLLRREVERP